MDLTQHRPPHTAKHLEGLLLEGSLGNALACRLVGASLQLTRGTAQASYRGTTSTWRTRIGSEASSTKPRSSSPRFVGCLMNGLDPEVAPA